MRYNPNNVFWFAPAVEGKNGGECHAEISRANGDKLLVSLNWGEAILMEALNSLKIRE